MVRKHLPPGAPAEGLEQLDEQGPTVDNQGFGETSGRRRGFPLAYCEAGSAAHHVDGALTRIARTERA